MEFRILGPLEVSEGDRLVRLSGARQKALLALLLLHANEVVSSDRLIDELWGEESPERGPNALQARVSKLRKALGPVAGEILLTRAPGYLLRVEAGALDVERFERLAGEGRRALARGDAAGAAATLGAALALWRGRLWRISPTSRSLRGRSLVWRRPAFPASRSGSRPISPLGCTASLPASSRLWSRRILCVSASEAS